MSTLGNFLWFILGGFLVALMYFVAGLVMCITIIGIPFGVQLMKIGVLALAAIFAITIIGIPFAKAHWRLMKMSFLPFGLTTS